MKSLTIIIACAFLAGCTTSQIYLKADDGTTRCEAKASGLIASSMANSKFGNCLEKTKAEK